MYTQAARNRLRLPKPLIDISPQKLAKATEVNCEQFAIHTARSVGGQVHKDYPAGATVGETREWLDRKYQNAINYALHNLGAASKLIGEGEAAIGLFTRALQHDEKSGRRGVSGNTCTWLAELMLSIRDDREASLKYLKQAATDRHWIAGGWLKRHFEKGTAFEPARNDEDFLAVVNAPVVTE